MLMKWDVRLRKWFRENGWNTGSRNSVDEMYLYRKGGDSGVSLWDVTVNIFPLVYTDKVIIEIGGRHTVFTIRELKKLCELAEQHNIHFKDYQQRMKEAKKVMMEELE